MRVRWQSLRTDVPENPADALIHQLTQLIAALCNRDASHVKVVAGVPSTLFPVDDTALTGTPPHDGIQKRKRVSAWRVSWKDAQHKLKMPQNKQQTTITGWPWLTDIKL